MTEFPADMFVKPVDGNDDLFTFRYDALLEGKASTGELVHTDENGDLIIEGYAAVWEGDDHTGENFAPGAFQAGLQRFLEHNPALCYHHKHDQVIGQVLDLREEVTPEGKGGLKMRARVDGSIQDHPQLKTVYQQIKNGTMKGLSTFGHFTRGIMDGAQKIMGVDLVEISITGVPMHPGTSFSVLAGKALDMGAPAPEAPVVDLDQVEVLAERFAKIYLPTPDGA